MELQEDTWVKTVKEQQRWSAETRLYNVGSKVLPQMTRLHFRNHTIVVTFRDYFRTWVQEYVLLNQEAATTADARRAGE